MTEERKIESCSRHTGVGYRLEWKITGCSDGETPQARAVRAAIEDTLGGYISAEWRHGPYAVQGAPPCGSELTPFVSKFDGDLTDMGLCRRATAEAALACLKSKYGNGWAWHLIDWRITAFRYERKWEIWRDEETER